MNVALSPEVERLVLSWGSQVEVLGPASLRQKIWDEALASEPRGGVSSAGAMNRLPAAQTLVF
jgi:hypothetical protein